MDITLQRKFWSHVLLLPVRQETESINEQEVKLYTPFSYILKQVIVEAEENFQY